MVEKFLAEKAKGFYHWSLSWAPCAKDSGTSGDRVTKAFLKAQHLPITVQRRLQNQEYLWRRRWKQSLAYRWIFSVSRRYERLFCLFHEETFLIYSPPCINSVYCYWERKEKIKGKKRKEREKNWELYFFLLLGLMSFYICLFLQEN